MTDVELVERAERLGERRWRQPCWETYDSGCQGCRGAALWQTLDGLRGLRLVSPTTGQRQGGDRE